MSSVHRYIEDRESQLVRNLQDMVRIGTVNPPGLDYRAMVVHLSARCQGLGMRSKAHRVPDGEVRRTAFWALGHCQDLELVPLLLRGLEDPDLAVVVEARDGLCVLCRKPRGILVNNKPLPANPLLGLPSGTTAEQKKVIEADWRKKVRLNWLRWYFRSRRYVDRDDLEELQFLRKEGSR